MTEETRPGFLANYKIVRPGPARIRPGPVDTSITNIKKIVAKSCYLIVYYSTILIKTIKWLLMLSFLEVYLILFLLEDSN